jgi:hypothetical protein
MSKTRGRPRPDVYFPVIVGDVEAAGHRHQRGVRVLQRKEPRVCGSRKVDLDPEREDLRVQTSALIEPAGTEIEEDLVRRVVNVDPFLSAFPRCRRR